MINNIGELLKGGYDLFCGNNSMIPDLSGFKNLTRSPSELDDDRGLPISFSISFITIVTFSIPIIFLFLHHNQ